MGALVKIVIKNLMLLCLFMIGMFSSLIIVKADEEEYYNKIMGLSSGYEIDSYDVNIDVKENNEFIVAEYTGNVFAYVEILHADAAEEKSENTGHDFRFYRRGRH